MQCFFSRRVVWTLVIVLWVGTSEVAAQGKSGDVPTTLSGHQNYLLFQAAAGSMPLVSNGHMTPVYVDEGEPGGLIRTVGDFREDVNRVTGKTPPLIHTAEIPGRYVVIVGTLDNSRLIRRLVDDKKIDVSAIQGKWDAFHLEVVEEPLPGVAQALVIAGSNMRGAIYGLYDVSEQIGVSPWYWWADVPVMRREEVYITAGTRIQEVPAVRYRGIFLNDEWPALTGWVRQDGGDYDHRFYEKVFELLLRLKANFLWPAMWDAAFNDDDSLNPERAHHYGIVLGTSHHEPMIRAHKEWRRYGEGPWDYTANREVLEGFWREGLERGKPYDNVITLGMRGDGDEPMSEEENTALLETIVANQRRLIEEVHDRPATEVPQVWALYKEVQGYYEKGMRVPEDVTLLWADDNFGNIRRLPTPEERKRSGGAGVYYHFDYVGSPRSYRWINTVPLAKIWEQMHLAYWFAANEVWVVNVGDLKPMEFPIEFFLRMAWNPEYWNKDRIVSFGRCWAAREFGEEHASEIEELLSWYTRHNGRRKPEHQDHTTYSQLHYREADRIREEVMAYTERVEQLYARMPETHKDAFFQLVYYPVKASGIITRLYDAVAKNHLYAAQGRANANDYAEKARELFAEDAALSQRFHTELAGGKWNHMMAQTRIGYVHWEHPPANTLPVLHAYEPHDEPAMGVAVAGEARGWPDPDGHYRLQFDPYGQQERLVEVYNRGTTSYECGITVSDPWIQVSSGGGMVETVLPVQVSIDWERAPEGDTAGYITITGPGWDDARIRVETFRPDRQTAKRVRGFTEADGYVSIEAEHYDRRNSVEGYQWEKIARHGRTLSSMAPFPVSDHNFESPGSGPYLEYEVYLFTTGEVTLQTIVAPSLNFVPGRGLRYAVAIGDEEPQIVDILENETPHTWGQSVMDAVRTATTTHTIRKPGLHRVRIYMMDHGVVLQKLLLDTGGLQPSYLGPEESEQR